MQSVMYHTERNPPRNTVVYIHSDEAAKAKRCQVWGSLATEGLNKPRCSNSHLNVSDKCEVQALQRRRRLMRGGGGLKRVIDVKNKLGDGRWEEARDKMNEDERW